MHIPTLTLTPLLFLLTAATASATALTIIPNPPTTTTTPQTSTDNLPLPEADITWTGPLEHGGANVTLHGKHYEIVAQLKEQNPYWIRNGSVLEDLGLGVSVEKGAGLEKRGRVAYSCMQSAYEPCSIPAIASGVRYIWSHYGNGNCGVAPYSCGRFSCSYDSAVLMCNSGSQWAWTPCSTLGTNANFILETCQNPGAGVVEGQAFYEDPTYNVLVKQTGPGNGC